jgi:hypothetical protein
VELAILVPLNEQRIYNIDLEDGKIFFFSLIYLLATKELVVL